MEVLERNGEIIFLRKLKEGPAAESYGLHVAALAGLPAAVLERAGELLLNLRKGEASLRGILPGAESCAESGGAETAALPLSAPPGPQGSAGQPEQPGAAERVKWAGMARLFRELETIDPNAVTPLEALETLYRLKKLAEAGPESTGREPAGELPARKAAEIKARNSGPSLFEDL
jgi:DNA mismatch repair protein MutS